MEEETDNATSQVLAELRVKLDGQMVGLDAPSAVPSMKGMVATTTTTETEEEALMDALPDLKARLDAL